MAVLVAALGVAVYLNYYFSVQQPDVLEAGADTTTTTASEADDGKNLGDAQYVNNPSTTPSETEATEPPGTIILPRRGKAGKKPGRRRWIL